MGHIGRSAGPQDVKAGWLLESAVRALGPYIEYPSGVICDRRIAVRDPTPGADVVWRPGDDPARRERLLAENPEREPSNLRRVVRRGLG